MVGAAVGVSWRSGSQRGLWQGGGGAALVSSKMETLKHLCKLMRGSGQGGQMCGCEFSFVNKDGHT